MAEAWLSSEKILQAFQEGGIDNVVILTGDIHSSWAMDITSDPFDSSSYDAATGVGSRAVEFVAPAVTSPGIADPMQAAGLQELVAQTHPHIKFAEPNRQGYLLVAWPGPLPPGT